MKNYIQKGDRMTITAEAAIASGELVKVGSIVGVACTDIAQDEEGEIALKGVFEVPKETGAIEQGAAVYFKADTKTVTTTSSQNTYCGYAFKAAGSGDATAHISLLW